MGRTPNYRFDRMQRDKAKADKKAEKAAAKEAKKLAEGTSGDQPAGTPGSESSENE